MEKAILVTYYSLTTLSTIGIGDYHPVSNLERTGAVFYMLIGVLAFSTINKQLIIMIIKIND